MLPIHAGGDGGEVGHVSGVASRELEKVKICIETYDPETLTHMDAKVEVEVVFSHPIFYAIQFSTVTNILPGWQEAQ